MLRVVASITIVYALFIGGACFESVHTKRVPDATVRLLEENFLMLEVLDILKNGLNRESIKTHLSGKSDRCKHIVSERQGEMIVDGYSVLELKSPIIGYSLFFDQESEVLIFVDTSVNPLNASAMEAAARLVDKAFDLVVSGDNSRLHFLGIHDLDNYRMLKIMVREAKTSLGKEYAIRYGISVK